MSLSGSSSGVTPTSSDVFENKTIDGDDNTLLDLKASSFKAGQVVADLGPAQPDHVKPASAKSTQDALALKADQSDLDTHTGDSTNPHSVTASQVGLGSVNNTADADKPVSTATQSALDLKANDADLGSHVGDTSNPHGVTQSQIGLGAVDNTSDLAKPISTATQSALDLKANDADLTSHTGDTTNPHSVTASQVGLGAANNTSDADKPISTATQAALDNKVETSSVGAVSGVAPLDGSQKVPLANLPDAVVGSLNFLGVWDADTNSPVLSDGSGSNAGDYYKVSVAGATLIDGMSDWEVGDWIIFSGTVWDKIDQTELVSSVAGKTGAVTLNSTDVGLGAVNNTSDADKPVSTATQGALDLKADQGALDTTNNNLSNHTGSSSNPHSVTATQVGLGSVDNTSDADKPVSTATQTALDLKVSLADAKKQAIKMAIALGG